MLNFVIASCETRLDAEADSPVLPVPVLAASFILDHAFQLMPKDTLLSIVAAQVCTLAARAIDSS